MSKVNSKKYWEERFETGDWNEKGGPEQSEFFYKIALDNLPEQLSKELSTASYTIHDWGCGQGEGTALFAKHFPNCLCTGWDFSSVAIKYAASKFNNCKYEVGDIYKDIKPADIMLSSNTLEHLSSPLEIMKLLAEKTKRHLILLLPFKDETGLDEHINIFTEESFPVYLKDLKLSYFKIIDCKQLPKSYWPGYQILLVYSNKDLYPDNGFLLSDVYKDTEYRKLRNEYETLLHNYWTLDNNNKVLEEDWNKQKLEARDKEKYINLYEETKETLTKEQQSSHTLIKTTENLTQQLKEKTADIKSLSKEKERLIAKNQQNTLKIEELQKQTASAKQENQKIGEELASSKEEVTLLKKEKQDVELLKKNHEKELEKARYNVYLNQKQNQQDNQALNDFLLNLSNTKIFRLAHYLTRFVQQFIKGSWSDKKDFFAWLFGDKSQKNHKYNPLYTAMALAKYAPLDISQAIPLEEEKKALKGYWNEDKNGDLEKDYSKQDVIVLSIIDYDFRYQRPQHFSKRFAQRGHRIFYVDANFKDAYEEFNIDENITGVRLSPAGAIYTNDWTNNFSLVQAQITQLIENNHISNALVVVDYPNWYNLANYLKQTYGWKVVMDYMDDFAGFINPVEDVVRNNCFKILSIADKVVASSQFLADFVEKYNDNVEIIRNATEYEFFHKASKEKKKDRKVIGYYGAISNWFNTEVVCKCAERFKDCDIVLIGEVTAEDRRFEKYQNVKMLGEKKYTELTKYLEDFDVAIIPFDTSTTLIKATNPVKFYEYLSAGKKIVATEIPELEPYKNKFCYLENDPKKFCDKVALCLKGKDKLASKEEMYAFAKANDWDARAAAFEDVIKRMYKKISIVVLCYNNLDYTKKCVDSILKTTAYPNYELIIVDNKSSDETPKYLKSLKDDRIKVILNKDNKGFAGGNNDGIKAADGDYIVLLNNDTEVSRGWLQNMLKHYDKDKTLGLVGPVTNSIGNEAKIKTTYESSEEMRRFAWRYINDHMGQEYRNVRMLAMFCLMFSREVFEKIGYLDTNYGIGMFEDDDYSKAALEAGYSLTIAEDSFVHHSGSESFKKINDEKRTALFNKNKQYYETKWKIEWIPHKYREEQ